MAQDGTIKKKNTDNLKFELIQERFSHVALANKQNVNKIVCLRRRGTIGMPPGRLAGGWGGWLASALARIHAHPVGCYAPSITGESRMVMRVVMQRNCKRTW